MTMGGGSCTGRPAPTGQAVDWVKDRRHAARALAGMPIADPFPQPGHCGHSTRFAMRNIHAIALAAALGLCAPLVFAQHHEHHPAPATTAATTAPVQRFATDAPLRKYMQSIRTSVAALEHGEHGHLDAGQVTTLATGIQRDIGNIVAECKLPADADAALHGIIGALALNADKLKANPQAAGAVAALSAALGAYAVQFDDPATGN
jgi:hypothetical protein